MKPSDFDSLACPRTLADLADEADGLGLRRAARALATAALHRALTRSPRTGAAADAELAALLARLRRHRPETDEPAEALRDAAE